MKLLVLSDSHATLRYMRMAIDRLSPDCVVHLGDYYEDALSVAEEYPGIPFYVVPGNCDRYRCGGLKPATLCPTLGGVSIYMTHGHIHRVKQTLSFLLADGRSANALVVLYGHTHIGQVDSDQGVLLVNPGSCQSPGGSVAVLELDGGRILECKLVKIHQLEEMQ